MGSETSFFHDLLGFLAGALLLIVVVGGGIAAALSEKVRGAIMLFIVFALAIKFLFFFFSSDGESKTVTQQLPLPPSNSSIVNSTPESATVTIENYRYKGDNVRITCSGPTGNVVCKPAQ